MRKRVLTGLLALVVAAGCGQKMPEPPDVRDVRPLRVEIGEKLLIELGARVTDVIAGAPTEVELEGAFFPSGEPVAYRTVTFGSARATAPEGITLPKRDVAPSRRILVDIDRSVEKEMGGFTRFFGVVRVKQGGNVYTSPHTFDITFFPDTPRKLGYYLAGKKEGADLIDWLGMRVEQVPRPDGDGTGLLVTTLRREFVAPRFIADYDCGIYEKRSKKCRAPLDAKVSREEALSQGVDARLYDEIDRNNNGMVDRHEAQLSNRDDSPAAAAGLMEGDIIVAANDQPISELGDLSRVWAGEGPDVSVAVLRGDGTATVSMPRFGKPFSMPTGVLLVAILVAIALLFVLPAPILGGFIVVWERKIAGYIQSRPGPNRVGPNGWGQWLADGIKLIVKEDLIPDDADPYLFRLSPYLVFVGVFATFLVLPFGPVFIAADLNIGVLYLLSVTSLVVVGVIMGGWASNSKWSLLGGMRSAAQIISYELPASLAVLTVVVMSGTLSTQGIVAHQGNAPWNWHAFDNPFSFFCFVIFFISALAEGNRTPFDLPEAESELVSGYNTEYSGFRFSIYFLAEWVNLIVISTVVVTVFLGGWHVPLLSPVDVEASYGWLAFLVFAVKVMTFIFIIIWIRWTLPRFRVDQMMNLCWKYFLPITLVSLVAIAAWVWIAPEPTGGAPNLRMIVRYATFGVFGVLPLLYFFTRLVHIRRTTSVYDLRGA